MKIHHSSLIGAVVLMALLSVCENADAAENGPAPTKVAQKPAVAETELASPDAMSAAGERIRQTGAQIRADIQEMREVRRQRAALEAKQQAERKKEAERARQQAKKDAEQLAAAKEAKQRQALEAAQARARQEAADRAAKAERERKLALDAQRALEEKLAKEQAAKAQAAKSGKGGPRLGGEVNFGGDI